MPHIRTRASKAKENNNVENKLAKNTSKVPRKPLADKTNSASDDASFETHNKGKKTGKRSNVQLKAIEETKPEIRLRSNRRLRNGITIIKSSNNNIVTPTKPATAKINESPDNDLGVFKPPSKAEVSLVVSRPRRICRLPSRFDDHSINPSKYIPLQPTNSSTPIQQSKVQPSKQGTITVTKRLVKTADLAGVKTTQQTSKSSPDTNNNAKVKNTTTQKSKALPPRKVKTDLNNINKFFNKIASPPSLAAKSLKSNNRKNENLFIRGDKSKTLGKSNTSNHDIYEFTFDPNEEPQLQKKKRRRVPAKNKPKVTKPKSVVTFKSLYDQNISKALSALKKAIKPPKSTNISQRKEINVHTKENAELKNSSNISIVSKENLNDTGKSTVQPHNCQSIRIEDIAANIETSIEHHDDLDYSPVNSPQPNNSKTHHAEDKNIHVSNKDPFDLQDDLSFFDDIPVASSSVNTSVRHPSASPWRVEFGNLPIKWTSNTYVKPNMTPSVECSFICSNDSVKKKHVYTNMVPMADDALPIISDTPNLKQTSIISFIKEVAEKKAQKKRGRSVSPMKAILENINTDMSKTSAEQKERDIPSKDSNSNNNTSQEAGGSNNDLSNPKEISKENKKTRKRKNNEYSDDKHNKSPCKQKDKDYTYFGFDDSETQDQENLPPVTGKQNDGKMSLRPRLRPVLQEINGPTRAALPVTPKSKAATSFEAVNKISEEVDLATDVPEFPEKNVEVNITDLEDPSFNDDSQSIHLFDDVEIVHHSKPEHRSYGKAKRKVKFNEKPEAGTNLQSQSDDDDDDFNFKKDLGDLDFEILDVNQKRKNKTKKKKMAKSQMSKEEAKAAAEWAAGFNSMCEEVEMFPLIVE